MHEENGKIEISCLLANWQKIWYVFDCFIFYFSSESFFQYQIYSRSIWSTYLTNEGITYCFSYSPLPPQRLLIFFQNSALLVNFIFVLLHLLHSLLVYSPSLAYFCLFIYFLFSFFICTYLLYFYFLYIQLRSYNGNIFLFSGFFFVLVLYRSIRPIIGRQTFY